MKGTEDLKDKLRKVMGFPPYDGFNTCLHDPYFWQDIRSNYTEDEIKKATIEIRKD